MTATPFQQQARGATTAQWYLARGVLPPGTDGDEQQPQTEEGMLGHTMGGSNATPMSLSEMKPHQVFAVHLGALVVKRAQFGRRDYCSIICSVFLPALMLAGCLSLVNSQQDKPPTQLVLDASQFEQYGGIPPLLEAASAPEPRARLAALQLLRVMATQSASLAASVAGAGGAPALVAALVTAAAEAKGWSTAGGPGRHTAEGEQAAGAALGALVALCGAAECAAKVQDAFRAASALPSLVALLGAKDEASRSLAMALLAHVAGGDGAGGELAASGGIALLCEGLVRAPRYAASF